MMPEESEREMLLHPQTVMIQLHQPFCIPQEETRADGGEKKAAT
jgi:hypothetical protein